MEITKPLIPGILQQLSKMTEGQVYQGFEAIVLKHGKAWPIIAKTLPKGRPRSVIKECFKNAAQLVLWRPELQLTYVEGYALGIFPVLHAWAVTPDGTVIDPTWNRKPYRPGTEYFGIPFKTQFLCQCMIKNGTYGILDCPPHFPAAILAATEAFKEAIESKLTQ
jgi:hypothetical protein